MWPHLIFRNGDAWTSWLHKWHVIMKISLIHRAGKESESHYLPLLSFPDLSSPWASHVSVTSSYLSVFKHITRLYALKPLHLVKPERGKLSTPPALPHSPSLNNRLKFQISGILSSLTSGWCQLKDSPVYCLLNLPELASYKACLLLYF